VTRARARATTRGEKAWWKPRMPSVKIMKATQRTKKIQWYQASGPLRAPSAIGASRNTAKRRMASTPPIPQMAER